MNGSAKVRGHSDVINGSWNETKQIPLERGDCFVGMVEMEEKKKAFWF
jgi:hypothetical protein